jgi:hypothetical protein
MGVCRHYLASAHELNDMISHDGEQEKKKEKNEKKKKPKKQNPARNGITR